MEVHSVVASVLEDIPEARDNDDILYVHVCQRFNPIACAMPFTKVLANRKDYRLPNYETVGRCRRKIQEETKEVRGSDEATDARYEHWKEVREYALSE